MADERTGADIRKLFETSDGSAEPEGSTSEGARIRALFPSGRAAETAPPPDPGMPSVDEYGRPIPTSFARPDPNSVAARIGTAAAEGWRAVPPILTPAAQEAVEQGGPVGRFIVNPALKIVGGVAAGANALAIAGMQGVVEGANAAGVPALGRDINMLSQVLPAGEMVRAPLQVRLPVAPEVNALSPKFVSERMAPPREAGATDADRILQLVRHDEAEVKGEGPQPPPPEGQRVAPPSAHEAHVTPDAVWIGNTVNSIKEIAEANKAAGLPGSIGAAATPAELARLTPEQMKAYRRQSELGQITAPPEPGLDRKIYIEGAYPTEAEYSGQPTVSQKEVLTRQKNPDAFEGEHGILTNNNKALVNAYEGEMGSDPQIVDLREQQRKVAEADTGKILASAKPADLQPLADYYNGILSNPRLMERPDVVNTITKLRDSLYDASGKLKTDPQQVWGMHDHLMTQMEKAKDPLNASSAEKFSFSQLQNAKKIADDVMNKATDGNFQTFLDHQTGFFQQINKMELLQKFRNGMTRSKDGMILADKFHRFVTDLAVRRGRQGVDPAMDIPDSTMQTLINIDSHLKRMGNIDLGKARGSPTNLFFELSKGLGIAGAHALVGATGLHAGGAGHFALQQGMSAAQRRLASFRLRRLTEQALSEPPGGYDRNALNNPSAPP
jgi:hypothetical protein